MQRAVIAIVDSAHARIFAYEEGAEDTLQLHELQDMSSAGRQLRVGETVDNHRDAKVEEIDSRFAEQIVGALDTLINQDGYRHLIVAASPKMLGALRNADGVLFRADLTVDEIPKVMTTLTVAQLHDHLAAQGLVPARRRLAAAR